MSRSSAHTPVPFADDGEDEPLRKRARIEDDFAGPGPSVMEMTKQDPTNSSRYVEGALVEAETQTVRDERYYFPHGDCVIRVEDTLFKVRVLSPPAQYATSLLA